MHTTKKAQKRKVSTFNKFVPSVAQVRKREKHLFSFLLSVCVRMQSVRELCNT